jgi:hypothetical protein
LPVFRTKKEAFTWLKSSQKTIDIRKGSPFQGQIAVYLSGRNVLRVKIEKTESGGLTEIVRSDNYRQIIPSAAALNEAMTYLRALYGGYDGVFTAYYVAPLA